MLRTVLARAAAASGSALMPRARPAACLAVRSVASAADTAKMLDTNSYSFLAEETLEQLTEQLDEVGDSIDSSAFDVSYSVRSAFLFYLRLWRARPMLTRPLEWRADGQGRRSMDICAQQAAAQ